MFKAMSAYCRLFWRYLPTKLLRSVGILWLISMLYPCLVSGRSALDGADTLPLSEQFQRVLSDLRSTYDFPGMTAAYRLPDGTVKAVAVGWADVEASVPITTESRMLAASIGKTFVGATVLSLVGQDQLELDVPVVRWLADRPWYSRLPNHDKITLRHLLQHTAGISNHVDEEDFAQNFRAGAFSLEQPPTPEELIAYILDQPALFAPGAGWHYSDTGYLIVGLIIEQVTGRPFYDLVKERFLQPLHLDDTSPSNQLVLKDLAAGYMDADNSFGLPPKTIDTTGAMNWHPGIEWTGGGFVSTPADLANWAALLFTGKAMPGDYPDDLLRGAPVAPDQTEKTYGIAVSIDHASPFGTSYGHRGWIPGYVSSVLYYPEQGLAIAVQINTDQGITDGPPTLLPSIEQQLTRVVLRTLSE